MRYLLTLFVILIAGCASTPSATLSGSQMKNDGPIRVERLGTTMYMNTSNESTCGDDRVTWCTGTRTRKACQCLTIREAEQQARRTLGQSRWRQP